MHQDNNYKQMEEALLKAADLLKKRQRVKARKLYSICLSRQS